MKIKVQNDTAESSLAQGVHFCGQKKLTAAAPLVKCWIELKLDQQCAQGSADHGSLVVP